MPAQTHTLAIVRIVGNELPPRHAPGSTLEQIEFILAHEPKNPAVKKLWVLNRIIDAKLLTALVDTFSRAGEEVRIIPFSPEDYKRYCHRNGFALKRWLQPLSVFLRKAGYIISLNDARNQALAWGNEHAPWVIPMDGGCCFTPAGLAQILERVAAARHEVYAIPMYRIPSYDTFRHFTPQEYIMHEPQLLFHNRSNAFSPAFRYGKNSKISALQVYFPPESIRLNRFATVVDDPDFQAGYVLRLPSGRPHAEGGSRWRTWLRQWGMVRLVRQVESALTPS